MKDIPNKYLFLLGGRDLEMTGIREILLKKGLQENIDFIDKQLNWGAKLSDYSEFLNSDKTIIGIELTPDIKPPKRYIGIDHHNQKANKKTSIEQVAVLLGVELNHYQMLIAANDAGYIPAMKAMGATENEIRQIRLLDRQAQGVTEQDEKLAEESIKKYLMREQGITVVKSLTSKFSAITDRLYPTEQLLIYNDKELTYYGKNVNKISRHFKELIQQQKAYSGGGSHGFFGIGQNAVSTDKLIEIMDEILILLLMKGKI